MLIFIGYTDNLFIIAKNFKKRLTNIKANYFGSITESEIKPKRIKEDFTVQGAYKVKINIVTNEIDIYNARNLVDVFYWGKISIIKEANVILLYDIYLINKITSNRLYLGCFECLIIGLVLVQKVEQKNDIDKNKEAKEVSLLFAPLNIYQYNSVDISFKFMNDENVCLFHKVQLTVDNTANKKNIREFIKEAHLSYNSKAKNIINNQDGIWFYYEHKVEQKSVELIRNVINNKTEYKISLPVLKINMFSVSGYYSILDLVNKIAFCIDYDKDITSIVYSHYTNFSKDTVIKKVIEKDQTRYYIIHDKSITKNKNLDFTDIVQTVIGVQANISDKDILYKIYQVINSKEGYLDENEIAKFYYHELNESFSLFVFEIHDQNIIIHFRVNEPVNSTYHAFHIKKILFLQNKGKNKATKIMILSKPYIDYLYSDFINTIFYFFVNYNTNNKTIKENLLYYSKYIFIDEGYINIEFFKIKNNNKEPCYMSLKSFTYLESIKQETFLVAYFSKKFDLENYNDNKNEIILNYSENYNKDENILAVIKYEKENFLQKVFKKKTRYSLNIVCKLDKTLKDVFVDNSIYKSVSSISGYFKVYAENIDYEYEDDIEDIFLPSIHIYLISKDYSEIKIHESK